MKRSCFGLALCYRKLPQDTVNAGNVQLFQRKLQRGLLHYAEQRDGLGLGWERLYNVDWRSLTRLALDELLLPT